jgi:pre-mRNA-splicing helicase BRR2
MYIFFNQNLQGTTHRHLSDHLSQLVEQTLEELQEAKCIEVDNDNVASFNLGMIASFYYINCNTIKLFSESLRARTRLQVLLDVISSASEFSEIPIRNHEDVILEKISEKLPRKAPNPNYNSPFFKASLLLQAHFSRFQLPPDLESDQKLVLSKVVPLLQACVDFIASNGWLNPALAAMELCQMCVQAMWDKDSPLKQVPHFNSEIIERLTKRGVERPDELIEMDEKDLKADLQLDAASMRDVIKFVNKLPIINVELKVQGKSVVQGEYALLEVELERDGDEDEDGTVIAPFFPARKEEGWWLVVGDTKTKTLLAIKRIVLQNRQSIQLEFAAPERTGKVDCRLFLMSDSYIGFDQDFEFDIEVEAGMEDADDDEEMQE